MCVCVYARVQLLIKLVKNRVGKTPSVVPPPTPLDSSPEWLQGVREGAVSFCMGPGLCMATSGETRDRCQISTISVRLFRYNLAEMSHPADINILIGVTIYSNNLTMLTHAEQMGSARELGGREPWAKTGWPTRRDKAEDL